MRKEVNWMFVGSAGALLGDGIRTRADADTAADCPWFYTQVLEYPEKTVVIYLDPRSVVTYPDLDTAKTALALRGLLNLETEAHKD